MFDIKGRRLRSQKRLMMKKWQADDGDRTLRFNYDLGENSIVLDLGGYEGQWASDLFARYRCAIHIFEPVRAFADHIRERFRKNDKIHVYACGLGGRTRSEEIRISADGSSMFSGFGNTEQIQIVDAKEWFAKNLPDPRHIDLMKVNIEGGEYELLDRLIETGLTGIIENIQVQFHDISRTSSLDMERIQAALMKTHEPAYQYRFVWENWRRKRPGSG